MRWVLKWGSYKNKHGRSSKKEASDGRDDEDDSVIECPSVHQQPERIHGVGQPHVLSEAVLWQVDEFSIFIIAICLDGLLGHDSVDPSAAEDGSNEIAQTGGEVEQADDDLAVVVRRLRKLLLDGNVGDEERPKGDGGGEDGDEDGREAEEEQHAEGVDEDALGACGEFLGLDLGRFSGCHAADGSSGWFSVGDGLLLLLACQRLGQEKD